MEIKNVKTIMDIVHGYVAIPKSFVKNIIDTDYFQRLRNIDQTGMKVLYPNAKHDRFSHSIGVFHLGRKAVRKLIQNIKDVYEYNFPKYFWEKNELLFLIACLLHDIGHAPFSHSLEDQVLLNSKVLRIKNGKEMSGKKALKEADNYYSITQKLIDLIYYYENPNETEFQEIEPDLSKVASHEQTGALMIFLPEFKCRIESIIEEIFLEEGLIENLEENDYRITESDLCFVARMIMGVKYSDWHVERQVKNAFIELLNGENFDVDNLDYIIRDTTMSGISNISVDVERLLNSICLVVKTKHLSKNDLFLKKGKIKDLNIVDIKNNSEASLFELSGNIRGSIILYKGTKVLMKAESEFESLRGIEKEQAKIKYSRANNYAIFYDKTFLRDEQGTVSSYKSEDGEVLKQLVFPRWNVGNECVIKEAKLKSDFNFTADEDIILDSYGKCNLEIKGKFSSCSPISLFSVDNIAGQIDEIEILGDTFKSDITENKTIKSDAYHIFSPAFDKKAVNLIANVLDARNYLYLWIYAHHKVVYYANFALPVITKEIFSKLDVINHNAPNTFPDWKLNFGDILYLDDAYIWTTIKYTKHLLDKKILKSSDINKEIPFLMNEILNHTYKNSLYKSFELTLVK